MELKDLGKTSTGVEAKTAGLLCYLVGFVSGIVFLAIEKENKFVRFHAMQSTITFGALFLLSIIISVMFSFVPAMGTAISAIVSLVQIALWIILMFKAYQGETFKLPIVGDIAEKQVQK